MTTFLLQHGWGFDAQFLTPLAKALERQLDVQTLCLDRGYFSTEDPRPSLLDLSDVLPLKGPLIGIGHSIGFALLHQNEQRLLSQNLPHWDALVSLSGFARFADTPQEKKALLLTQKAFNKDPKALLKQFYQFCMVPASSSAIPDFSQMNLPLLKKDLDTLSFLDIEESLQDREIPLLALHDSKDSIVSQRSLEILCDKDSQRELCLLPSDLKAGHALGLNQIDFCVQSISLFLQKHSLL